MGVYGVQVGMGFRGVVLRFVSVFGRDRAPRWNTFRRVLFTEERDPDQKLKLMLFMTPALIVGVTLRLVVGPPYAFGVGSVSGGVGGEGPVVAGPVRSKEWA